MDEQVKVNILRVLDRAIVAVKGNDAKELKDLSNETIHDATVYQDEYSIAVAVMFYVLSKIYERDIHYNQFKGWKNFCTSCVIDLETARAKLKENDIQGFDSALKGYLEAMRKLDKKLVKYVQDVLYKARITKASRLYEHGLSIGRTAELLGVSKYELMDYIGRTYIADMKDNVTINIKERLKFARGLF